MNKIFVLVLTAMIACSLVMTGCEAENPGEPLANQAPDTYISEASPGNTTTIAFYGTDKDGFVDQFAYRWDTDNTWTQTTEIQIQFADIFESESDMRTFFVRGIDDRGMEDPTPAEISLTPTNALPETEITGGPEFGRESGEDVTFTFEGIDAESDGGIEAFEYTLDDLDNWETTSADYPHAVYLGLAAGAHTFYVRAIDNLGGADPTPAQVAFVVEVAGHSPTIVNRSPVSEGGGWFAGVDLTFSWDAVVADYYGALPEAPYSYAFDDDTNFDDTDTPMASGWVAGASSTIAGGDMTAGSHTFYLKARDTAGKVSLMSMTFEVAEFNPTQGILVIDDFSWDADVYDGDTGVDDAIANGFMNGYSFTQRNDDEDPVGPADLAPYSTVILYGDYGYSNQTNGDLFAAYATAGGNLLISGYNLVDMAPSFAAFGVRPQVFGLDAGNYGGMDGQAGTAYADWNINLPGDLEERTYQRVYPAEDNTESIFAVRGLDGDDRSCAVRADMPLGNVVIIIGQSLPFLDQTSEDTRAFGDYVLGTEFGEPR